MCEQNGVTISVYSHYRKGDSESWDVFVDANGTIIGACTCAASLKEAFERFLDLTEKYESVWYPLRKYVFKGRTWTISEIILAVKQEHASGFPAPIAEVCREVELPQKLPSTAVVKGGAS